jgi:hypothetical protein
MKPQTRSSSAGRQPKRSVVAVERGLAVSLFCVVLGALDGADGFIEQRAATGEVAAVERVKRVLAPLSSSSRIVTAVVVAVRRQVTLGTDDEPERQTSALLVLCAAIHKEFIFLVMDFTRL